MTTYKVVVLPGDGVGPEIVEQGIKVLKAFEQKFGHTFELEYADIGGAGIDSDGVPLPEKTLKLSQQADAVFLGAVGDYKYDTLDPAIRPEQGLLQIRKAMGLYANLRPVKAYKALIDNSTLKPEIVDGIDIMVVRELTGGLYFGQPKGREKDQAVDTMRYLRTGFELAMKRDKKLCSVDKANVLATSQAWREIVESIAKEFPQVELSHMYVDNASMQLIRNPRQFDVLLTENTFGDILSDEASMLTGSLGMLGSASLGADKNQHGCPVGLYEPSHGSAPKYKGQDKVNPIAQIQSLKLMLEHGLGLSEESAWIDNAIVAVLDAGYRTYDIMGTDTSGNTLVGTSEMGSRVAEALLKLPEKVCS